MLTNTHLCLYISFSISFSVPFSQTPYKNYCSPYPRPHYYKSHGVWESQRLQSLMDSISHLIIIDQIFSIGSNVVFPMNLLQSFRIGDYTLRCLGCVNSKIYFSENISCFCENLVINLAYRFYLNVFATMLLSCRRFCCTHPCA